MFFLNLNSIFLKRDLPKYWKWEAGQEVVEKEQLVEMLKW